MKDIKNRYDVAMQSIMRDSYSRSTYDYLRRNKEWRERFEDFLRGNKTLPLLYDPFFKKLFHPIERRDRLSEFVSCLLGQAVTVLEVLPNEDSQFIGVFVIMDMVVRMSDGSIANIEIQKVPYAFPAERISCYSADLVMRQYKLLTGDHIEGNNERISYGNMRKVHTIIFFEKSSSHLINMMNEELYFHVGKTTFNTGIKMELLQDFLLISLDTFKQYRYSEIKEGRIEIKECDYDGTQYEAELLEDLKQARLKYLSLFVAESVEDIDRLVEVFPDLEGVRRDINEYLTTPKEVLNMFSEALRILDRNTAELMIDQMKAEAEEMKVKNEEMKTENEAMKVKNEEMKAENEEMKAENEAMRIEIERLKAQIENMKK